MNGITKKKRVSANSRGPVAAEWGPSFFTWGWGLGVRGLEVSG
jgi:hypothetical protein